MSATTESNAECTWPPRPARHAYDGLDGAYIVHHPSGFRAETYGDEMPSLALRRQPGNGGVRIRFDERDDAWRALAAAAAGEAHVETTLDGYVRNGNEVERHCRMTVVIGRMQRSDRILIGLHPLGPDATRGITLRLDRDDARALARAMLCADHERRRALVFEEQHRALSIAAFAAHTERARGR